MKRSFEEFSEIGAPFSNPVLASPTVYANGASPVCSGIADDSITQKLMKLFNDVKESHANFGGVDDINNVGHSGIISSSNSESAKIDTPIPVAERKNCIYPMKNSDVQVSKSEAHSAASSPRSGPFSSSKELHSCDDAETVYFHI